MPLELEDCRHFTAAEGYLELGMPLDANEDRVCAAEFVEDSLWVL
jgi:hypothetical protein